MVAGFGVLIDGRWTTDDAPPESTGEYKRRRSVFRDVVTPHGKGAFTPEAGRYHLYLSHACPWSHRTSILRGLKGLEDAIGMTAVNPVVENADWEFNQTAGFIDEPLFGARFLHEIYVRADPKASGNVTVPVLFDTRTGAIVNNESREIMRTFDHGFDGLARNEDDLAPPALLADVERHLDEMYEPINNGVYRAGFAKGQGAYDRAVRDVFSGLERYERILSQRRYLCGDRITEADVALFVTLLRFDPVYHGHFKCNLWRIADSPALSGYVRDLYQHPRIRPTCHLDEIKAHYYRSHRDINPSGIVPLGPLLDLDAPHGRGARVSAA